MRILKIFLLIYSSTITVSAFAKDCDSELAGHLIKINDSFSANAELFLGSYYSNLTGANKLRFIPMVNVATDVTFNSTSSLYFNGAIKHNEFSTSNEVLTTEEGSSKGTEIGSFKVGLRELHYENRKDSLSYRIGFMTYSMENQLLMDERALGIDIISKNSLFNIRFFAAGLLDPFARQKQSCVSKSTFRPHEETEIKSDGIKKRGAGKNFTMINHFMGFQIDFSEQKKASASDTTDTQDEFKSVDENESNEIISSYGLLYLLETSDNMKNLRHYPGLFFTGSLANVDFATETALQFTEGDITLGYIIKLHKTFIASDTSSYKIFYGYTAFNNLKGKNIFSPHNSHMSLSDVNQYHTADNNVIFYGINYNHNSTLSFETTNYNKLFDENSSELDLGLTWHYQPASKIKLGGNLLYGKVYASKKYQSYFEIRHIF